MIFRQEIPQEIYSRFLYLFGKPLETYWDTFWGWKEHSPTFEEDFPILNDEQYELIKELEALEAAQFEEVQKIAAIQLTIFPKRRIMSIEQRNRLMADRRWLPWED